MGSLLWHPDLFANFGWTEEPEEGEARTTSHLQKHKQAFKNYFSLSLSLLLSLRLQENDLPDFRNIFSA